MVHIKLTRRKPAQKNIARYNTNQQPVLNKFILIKTWSIN